jgi:ATP-binding cassette, subfamily B, multidrug efflux pump
MSQTNSLKQLIPFLKPFKKTLILIFASVPVIAFLQGVQPYLLQLTIEKLNKVNQSENNIYLYPVLIGASILILFGFKVWQNSLVQEIGQKFVFSIRTKLFSHLQSLSIDFFEQNQVGKLLTRLTSDIEALSETFSSGLVGGTNDIFCLMGIIIFMFYIDWKLALIQIILLPILILLTKLFEKDYQKANLESRKQLGQLNSLFQESLLGLKVIKLFNQFRNLSREFAEVTLQYIKANNKYIFADSLFSAVIELISILAIILVIISTLIFLKNGFHISAGKLIAFVGYTQILFGPIRSLSEKFSVFQSGFTAANRISELLSTENKFLINNIASTKAFPERLNLKFEQVYFKYKAEGNYALENISFNLEEGHSLGIVGQTGSGKSTLIKLLCRFYDPTQGKIIIENTDLTELDPSVIRQNILMIPQRSFLFSGSIKDNLLLNKTDFSDQQLKNIAEETGLLELISNLKDGFNTELREGGVDLSSGQKQLISLTRALIQNSKVLILDEATASLDAYTEQIVTKAVQKIIHSGKTVIFIAHRLNLVKECNKILVLQNGKIKEAGSHKELMELNNYYSQLVSLSDLI